MAAAADAGMDAKLFADLIKQLKATSFSSAKESLIELAVTTNAFSVAQAVQIVAEFSFSADKEKVALALKDHLVDPQHKDKLTGTFSGSAKTKLEAEFKNIKAKAALHIPPALLLPNAALRDEKSFNALIEKIKKENFSSGKIDVLKAELKANSEGFSGAQTVAVLKLFTMSSDMVTAVKLLDDHILGLTCAEVNAILSVFSFSSDRLTVLPLIKDTILDGQLKHIILNEFTMSTDKEKAAEILKSVKAAVPPRSPLFGTVRALNAVFVIDVSGSMDAAFKHTTGETLTRLQLAVRELKNVINEHLAANANFQIISFSSGVHPVFKEPVTATAANREAACKALNALKPNGSTNAAGALKAAFDMKACDAVYFLTDGEPDTPAAGIVTAVQGYLKAHPVPIFGIFLGLPGKVPKARQFVLDLTKCSNGVFRAFE